MLLHAPSPRDLQLCAAALLARIADGADGTRQILACHGLRPLAALWESATTQSGTLPLIAAVGATPHEADTAAAAAAAHGRHASMYASTAVAHLVLHTPTAPDRLEMLQAGVVSPLLAMVAPEPDPRTRPSKPCCRPSRH